MSTPHDLDLAAYCLKLGAFDYLFADIASRDAMADELMQRAEQMLAPYLKPSLSEEAFLAKSKQKTVPLVMDWLNAGFRQQFDGKWVRK